MKSHYSYAKAQGDANHSWQSWGHRYLSAYGATPQEIRVCNLSRAEGPTQRR